MFWVFHPVSGRKLMKNKQDFSPRIQQKNLNFPTSVVVLNLDRCLGSPGGVFEGRGSVSSHLWLPSTVRLIGELGIAAVGPGTAGSGAFCCFGHRLFKFGEYNGMRVEYSKGKRWKGEY
jgi:hypothetical protein